MEIDFHEHLDTARLWWDLDEAVLRAIAEGRATQEPFRKIALYVLELKAASTVPQGEEDTAALTKIAVRIAGAPPLAGAEATRHRSVARTPTLKIMAIAMLATLALAALLTAAGAAELIPLPESIRQVLDKIGVHIEATGDQLDGNGEVGDGTTGTERVISLPQDLDGRSTTAPAAPSGEPEADPGVTNGQSSEKSGSGFHGEDIPAYGRGRTDPDQPRADGAAKSEPKPKKSPDIDRLEEDQNPKQDALEDENQDEDRPHPRKTPRP